MLGDQMFIYHSSCKDVGIVGLAEVVKEGYVDHDQFDPDKNIMTLSNLKINLYG